MNQSFYTDSQQTIAAFKRGDLVDVGRLMNASHDSRRDDYEVSSAALDVMVEAMRKVLAAEPRARLL